MYGIIQLLTRLRDPFEKQQSLAIIIQPFTQLLEVGKVKLTCVVFAVVVLYEWIVVRVLLDVERTIHHQENIDHICSAHACQVVIRLICS